MPAVNVFDIPLKTIDGEAITLDAFRGKAMLVVNVASRCGFTPQYAELETLYRRHKDRLVVLGFPCNQFGSQEPGDERQIRKFCSEEYDVTFPLFAKVDVNGPAAHPLYQYLKSEKKGLLGRRAISWNFTKFLIDKDGQVVRRYGPRRKPQDIEKDVLALV